jgi:hypothetical protein
MRRETDFHNAHTSRKAMLQKHSKAGLRQMQACKTGRLAEQADALLSLAET